MLGLNLRYFEYELRPYSEEFMSQQSIPTIVEFCDANTLPAALTSLLTGRSESEKDRCREWTEAAFHNLSIATRRVILTLWEPPEDALHRAVRHHDLAGVRLLLQHGVTPGATTLAGITPLMSLSVCLPDCGSRSRPYQFNEDEQDAVVAALATASVGSLEHRDEHGWTALMLAAGEINLPLVRSLIRHGAGTSINAQDSNGLTALMHAASRRHRHHWSNHEGTWVTWDSWTGKARGDDNVQPAERHRSGDHDCRG